MRNNGLETNTNCNVRPSDRGCFRTDAREDYKKRNQKLLKSENATMAIMFDEIIHQT